RPGRRRHRRLAPPHHRRLPHPHPRPGRVRGAGGDGPARGLLVVAGWQGPRYEEADTSRVDVLHIADPMHPERPADAWPYPRPGRENAAVRLGVVPAAGGGTVWVEWDRGRYPYLAAVRWQRGGPLTLLVQNREQTTELLLAADPATGATRTLLAERDDAWLDL